METVAKRIHNKVYSSALAAKALSPITDSLVEESRIKDELGLLGFGQSTIIKAGNQPVKSVIEHQKTNDLKQWLNDKLLDPRYKIVDYGTLMRVLGRYNLFIGPARSYQKEVPLRAANRILEHSRAGRSMGWAGELFKFRIMSLSCQNPTYFVCGPKADFAEPVCVIGRELCYDDTAKTELSFKMFKFEWPHPDPIVVSPLLHLGAGMMLLDIVDAWDREASDPDIVNEVQN